MNIIQAMTDANLFGDQFSGESWNNWRTLLAGFYGLEVDAETWTELTRRDPPSEPHKELWLPVGRRGGKSQCAALLAVYEALFNDYRDRLSPGEVATVMVIAADRKQARTIMRYIRGLLESSPMLTSMIYRDTHDSIELVNRCSIEIMTASHRGVRGYTIAAAILDEVAFWYSEGANPDSEILSALRPAMATLGGKLIALSSPYARRGILWNAYRKHFGKDSRVLVAQAPTWIMNPTLPDEVIKDAYEDDPTAAAAEYGALFRSDIESYVPLEVVEASTRQAPHEIPYCSGIRYEAFVDPSGGIADAFGIAIAHREGDEVVVDVARRVKPPFSPEAVVEELAELLKSYRISQVKGDAYAGEWPREQFRKRGIKYLRSEKNRSELYRDLLPLLNSSRVQLPDIHQLRTELVGLERRTTRGGRDIIDHAPGGHDDLANAVAGVCVFMAQRRPVANVGSIKFML